ncbi:hypothetical protein ACMV8I_20115 [Ewingella sp. S1.OA.A_B6]
MSAIQCFYSGWLSKSMQRVRATTRPPSAITFRAIAEVIGRRLDEPANKADVQFGWLNMFASKDMSASNAITQQKIGWHPTGTGLLNDIAQRWGSLNSSSNLMIYKS